ncbi:quinone oxidoreductase family protein [Rhodoligotrophos defluvii]|uniref:quinone oxidoreductase family protein n=1 Tax=Rhodoligotrophos defluvii TaxID=2561934 RepID=UPI0010CA06A2|nr:quinone oxidoreductase [Rhodoligotrophos defluvii]
MVKAIRIHAVGGPEVLKLEEVTVAPPGQGEVQIKHAAIGLNFIDVYYRTGLYPAPLPLIPGMEAAGVVTAVGEGVGSLKRGDRVAYGTGPLGAYSEIRNMPANRVVKLPEAISDETAAAMMLKGMTASYLLHETYKVQPGDTVLFHAAAGGVGLIACQWAKLLGATVIGTVGSPEKAALARAHGCDHTIDYTRENVAERVRALTNGEGVPVVYDSVGAATLEASLASLRPRGLLVSFGNASGPIKNFDLIELSRRGSLYVTRPTLMTYAARDEDLARHAAALMDVVASGRVKIEINQRYALADAAQAHRDLEARRTTGTTLLIP